MQRGVMHPLRIHQLWFDIGCGEAPPYADRAHSFRTCNPAATYHLWREDDARTLVRRLGRQVLELYDALPHGINRCDLFRYVVLHAMGGWYFDLDFVCLLPLPLPGRDVLLGEEWPGSASKTVHNGALCSPAGHPFWLLVLDEVRTRLRALPQSKLHAPGSSVLHLTGPAMLRDVASRARVRVLPFHVLCPLVDAHGRPLDARGDRARDRVDLSRAGFAPPAPHAALRALFPRSLTAPLANPMVTWQAALHRT